MTMRLSSFRVSFYSQSSTSVSFFSRVTLLQVQILLDIYMSVFKYFYAFT